VFHVGGGSADRALSCDLRFKGMFCLALVYVWGAALEIGARDGTEKGCVVCT
jgi:hypothetical protein